MNSLPTNWTESPLSEILILLESGSRPKGGVKGIENGIPSIGCEHLNDRGSFKFNKIKYVPEEFANSMTIGHVQIYDILIVKDGATTGKVSLVDKDFPYKRAVVNEHVFFVPGFFDFKFAICIYVFI